MDYTTNFRFAFWNNVSVMKAMKVVKAMRHSEAVSGTYILFSRFTILRAAGSETSDFQSPRHKRFETRNESRLPKQGAKLCRLILRCILPNQSSIIIFIVVVVVVVSDVQHEGHQIGVRFVFSCVLIREMRDFINYM